LSIRLLSRDVAFYGILDFLQRSLSIILVPIYTRVLTRNQYGNLDVILVVWSVLTVLVDLQFIAGFSRLYLERRRAGDGPRFVGTAILTRTAVSSVLAALVLALGFAGLLEFRFIPSFLGNRTAWTVVILGVPVALAYDVLLAQAQMLRWKKSFFAGAFGNTLISTVLCVLLTVVMHWGIVGVAVGQMTGTLVATGVLFTGLRGEISFQYQRGLLREIAQYSLPLVPGRWLNHFSAYVGRFFIFAGLGAAENAILAITTKLAAVVALFCLAFRTAWQPLAMSYIGDQNSETFYVRSLRVFMAGGLFSVACLILLARPVLAILAPDSYAVAEYYVPFFLVASIIGELDINLQLANQIAKKTYWISIGSVLAFAINVLILMTMTERLRIYAVGIGLLLAFLAKAALTYVTGQRNYKIAYDKVSLSLFFVGCASFLILATLRSAAVLNGTSFYVAVAVVGLVLPLFTLGSAERLIIHNLIAARIPRRLTARRVHNL
jgi:O-antigen/teichoic acid export membrane protein